MRGCFGHYADVTRRICNAFETGEVAPHVWCNAAASQDCINYFSEAGFPISAELQTSNLRPWEKFLFRQLGLGYYKSWKRRNFPSSGGLNFKGEAPIFVPSAEVADAFTLCYRKQKTLLGFWGSPEVEFKGAIALIRDKLKQGNCSSLILGAYDDFTFSELEVLSPFVQVVRLPCPYDNETQIQPLKASDKLRVGFFGWMRQERGGHLKSDIISRCVAAGFKVTDTSNSNLEVRGGNVNSHRYVDSLGAKMKECDIVVWPSDAESYLLRTSGIVFHALANGIPLVVPENCRPSEILMRYEHPHLTFREQSSEAVMDVLQSASTQIKQLQSKATASTRTFNEAEGSSALAKRCNELLF